MFMNIPVIIFLIIHDIIVYGDDTFQPSTHLGFDVLEGDIGLDAKMKGHR